MKISRASGLRIFNLQSSIQDALARASTSWIALSTYLENFRKSCQRILNLPSRFWIASSADLKNPKGRPGSARCQNQNVDVHLHCLQLARGKNVADTVAFFCGLEGWARTEESQIPNLVDLQSSMQGAKPLMSLEQIVKFLGGQD